MKLLQINAVYGYSSTGTIMKLIHDCALKNGIDSYVAYSRGNGLHENRSIEVGNKIDHKIHAIMSRIAGRQAYFSHIPTWRLIRDIDILRPDIVHLHNLHSNYVNLNMLLLHLAKRDIATVITMHDCWYFTGGCFHYANIGCDKWKTSCGQCPKRKADTPALLYDASRKILRDRKKHLNAIPRLTMVGCSEWVAEECKKSAIGNKEIITIHNGFDLDIYRPLESDWRKRLGLENKFVILAPASKWMQAVNQPTFEYFKRNMADDMTLLLFGSPLGDHRENERIRHIGFIRNPEEMAGLYSMADVMANCSREDTLSSLNLEAQACGTPVVTYEATGSKETVDGICGFAVATGDYEALFRHVKNIASAGKQSFSQKCREFIESEYERNDNFQKYISLYQQIITGKPTR